ncbi:Sec-independent protein translocase subunit TatA [Pseudonocardia sp. DLS-67]
MPSLGGWEIVILLGVLVLVFGARKLPDMARSVGQSARVFKGEMKDLKRQDAPASSTGQPTPSLPTEPVAEPAARPATVAIDK